MTLGQKVKDCREKCGYTQVEFAKRIQTSQAYVSRLEKDDFNPSTQMIISIAATLGVSIDYLLVENKKAI